MENSELANRSPILSGIRQLLPTLHKELLQNSETSHGINKKGKRKGVGMEP